jgi:hypothetical protein
MKGQDAAMSGGDLPDGTSKIFFAREDWTGQISLKWLAKFAFRRIFFWLILAFGAMQSGRIAIRDD